MSSNILIMKQSIIDEKVKSLYEKCRLPGKIIGKFRIELLVLEEEHKNNPSNLNRAQLKRLSSLYNTLGRLRVEMGISLPLFYYQAMTVIKESDSSFEKIFVYGVTAATSLAGLIFVYMSRESFRKAEEVKQYTKT